MAATKIAPSRLARLRKLGGADWLLLGEAAVAVTIASAAIALLPFRRLAGLMGRDGPPEQPSAEAVAVVRKVRWSVEATSRRLPWKTVCFQKGLALHWMLRRRRLDSRLHYGVAQSAEEGLRAHVWVSWREGMVIGGEVADQFTCLAIYPPAGDPPPKRGKGA